MYGYSVELEDGGIDTDYEQDLRAARMRVERAIATFMVQRGEKGKTKGALVAFYNDPELIVWTRFLREQGELTALAKQQVQLIERLLKEDEKRQEEQRRVAEIHEWRGDPSAKWEEYDILAPTAQQIRRRMKQSCLYIDDFSGKQDRYRKRDRRRAHLRLKLETRRVLSAFFAGATSEPPTIITA